MKALPNILILGTPGCGKTTFASALCDALNVLLRDSSSRKFTHIEVSRLIKEESLYDEWDQARDCSIYDEERLMSRLEDIVQDNKGGGCIMDFHSALPVEREWFQGFILLRCGTEALFDRLTERGYPSQKVEENNQAEIFGVVKEELLELIPDFGTEAENECHFEFENDNFGQLEFNMQRVISWVRDQMVQ
eukprot:Gregarina_sp_Poly_1__760@NODE_1182_length_4849_cov_31_140945_g812_i0_p5_GENE_NODE_1182_length_4849_cov_31_140945_g812_i0NODE_1182_length_4849_cov_31_140945_g812_i0_p5_ORF_typecomplete_len191_score33_65AAA_18/PF13238_6/7_2e28AAA_17/PF13207_6/1_1e08AAA_33/PF13671_6/9_9e08RuvB_N/PF05496_12/3_2e06AAA_5/PF07728_14/4_1e06AAA_2/PF07724_14/4e05AAA_28/PF13521_6/5_8e05ADK/PF00406_22/0_00074AAA/PF00004_29/4_5e05PRK/PF00485_18/5_8e05AAA_22/PF13401_6/0_0001IstB_IS21/PF01695_17/0_00012KTI12/PF08433_10/0_0003N